MNIKPSIFVALVSLALTATAQSDVISQAYEVSLQNFTAPATTNSGVSFKECDECDRRIVRVNANTRYNVNGTAVRLDEFRRVLAAADRDETWLTVLHHLESDTIKMIAVSF